MFVISLSNDQIAYFLQLSPPLSRIEFLISSTTLQQQIMIITTLPICLATLSHIASAQLTWVILRTWYHFHQQLWICSQELDGVVPASSFPIFLVGFSCAYLILLL